MPEQLMEFQECIEKQTQAWDINIHGLQERGQKEHMNQHTEIRCAHN